MNETGGMIKYRKWLPPLYSYKLKDLKNAKSSEFSRPQNLHMAMGFMSILVPSVPDNQVKTISPWGANPCMHPFDYS